MLDIIFEPFEQGFLGGTVGSIGIDHLCEFTVRMGFVAKCSRSLHSVHRGGARSSFVALSDVDFTAWLGFMWRAPMGATVLINAKRVFVLLP